MSTVASLWTTGCERVTRACIALLWPYNQSGCSLPLRPGHPEDPALLRPNEPTPPTELAVVGERKDNPEELLVIAQDGKYYAYSVTEGTPHPVQPDDAWKIDPVSPDELFT